MFSLYQKYYYHLIAIVGTIIIGGIGIIFAENLINETPQTKELNTTINSQLPVQEPTEIQNTEPAPVMFDLTTDSSFQKYVGKNQSLSTTEYKPEDLEAIISDFTANNSKRFLMRKEAGIAFADMARNFRNEFKGDKLTITSTYRSNGFQLTLLKRGCNRNRCAEAGASEHQLGLAIDIGVITKGGKYIALAKGNKYYERLANNAHKFGFHNTYQKGLEIDGQMEEGRHRRYLGTPLAEILYNQNITFAEYYNLYQNF